MSQTSHIDSPTTENSNGEARPSRNLIVREHEMHGLAPYMYPGAMPYVDAPPAGVSFSQLRHALRRRWLLACVAGLLIGLPVAALVWLVTPENYEVTAWLRVGDVPGVVGRSADYEQYRQTQVARIKSPSVLQAAYGKEGVADLPILRAEREPLQFLQDEIMVVAPLNSEVLLIKMRGKDKTQLVKIVNAVQQAYMDNVVDAEHAGLLKQQELLQNAKADKDREILEKRTAIQNLQKKLSTLDQEDIRWRVNQLQVQSNDLLQQITQTKVGMSRIDQRIAILKQEAENPKEPDQHIIESILQHDDTIVELTRQLNQNNQMIGYQLGVSRLKERDPSVIRFRQSVAGIEEQLQKRKEILIPQIIAFLRTQPQNGEETGTVEQLEAKRQILEKLLAEQKENLEAITAEAAKYGGGNVDIKDLNNQVQVLETGRGQLVQDLMKLDLDLHQPSRVTVIEKAIEPEGTNPFFRYALTIFAGIAGLVIGAGAVVAVEYQARRLSTTSELSTNTGLRVLGVVPNLDALSGAKGANGAAALQGILAESVDSIRTILLQQSKENAPKVVLVTSAGDREGKTTVAAHLAASLARAGRRTLLVDGDLRSPTAHAMFGASQEPGLCEILRGETDLEGAIQPTQVDGLMLVPAGQCDYQSIAALAKSNLHDVFERIREQFDFVIIDAAPVLNYADTLLMGGCVDAAVISTRRDVSQLHKVYEARERLESVGIRVLGAVVNGITEVSRRPAFALPS